MNKKYLTITVTAVCFIFMAAVTVGVLMKNGIINVNNLFSQSEKNSDTHKRGKISKVESAKSSFSDKNIKEPIIQVFLSEGGQGIVQKWTDTDKLGEYEDIKICFNKVTTSKKIGDFDNFDDWDEKKDAKGNITNDYTYVILDVTLKYNDKKTIDDFSLLGVRLCIGNPKCNDSWMPELRSYNSNRVNKNTKDYYTIKLTPDKKEYHYNLVYVVKDEILKKKKNEPVYIYYNVSNYYPRPGSAVKLIDKTGKETWIKF